MYRSHSPGWKGPSWITAFRDIQLNGHWIPEKITKTLNDKHVLAAKFAVAEQSGMISKIQSELVCHAIIEYESLPH